MRIQLHFENRVLPSEATMHNDKDGDSQDSRPGFDSYGNKVRQLAKEQNRSLTQEKENVNYARCA